MKEEDLKFEITNSDGKVVECDILSLFPKDNIESYMVFIDDERDEDGNVILKYGKLIKKDGDFELTPGVSDSELEYIKEKFYEDLLDLANSIVQQN